MWLLWATFIAYTLLLAFRARQGRLRVIVEKILKFRLQEVNRYVATVFAFMGVWLIIYACLLYQFRLHGND